LNKLKDVFPVLTNNDHWYITYTDDEDDNVFCESEEECNEALQVGTKCTSLKVLIEPRDKNRNSNQVLEFKYELQTLKQNVSLDVINWTGESLAKERENTTELMYYQMEDSLSKVSKTYRRNIKSLLKLVGETLIAISKDIQQLKNYVEDGLEKNMKIIDALVYGICRSVRILAELIGAIASVIALFGSPSATLVRELSIAIAAVANAIQNNQHEIDLFITKSVPMILTMLGDICWCLGERLKKDLESAKQ
jgi:hypothetical protein